jgi:L-ribulose-5-phosphate 3-epimerase
MTPLAGHTGSYYSYSFEQACAGLAEAGYRAVELSAVPGATEHVDVHGDPAEVRARLDHFGLEALSISGHSDLTAREGLEHGLAVVSWAERFGLPVVNTAIGGHAHVEESEDAFLRNIGPLADAAQVAGIVIALEIHGDLMASGERSRPLLDRIGHPAVAVNYDTANVEYYGGVRAEDDLAAIADRVANVHLKDYRKGPRPTGHSVQSDVPLGTPSGERGEWDFPAIGQGHVDFGRVIEILRGAGFEGPYSVEVEFTGGVPWPPLEEVNAAMRASREALSAHGLS